MDKSDPDVNNRIEQLKKLIELAWSDGIMTDQERAYIYQKARELGISTDTVVTIDAEVKRNANPIPEHVLTEIRTYIELALADGQITSHEIELIKNKCETHSLSESQINILIEEVQRKLLSVASPSHDPKQATREKLQRSLSETIQEVKKGVVRINREYTTYAGTFVSSGSGVVVHKYGIVITNDHVIYSDVATSHRQYEWISDRIHTTVDFIDGSSRQAFIIKAIPEHDIAFLGVDIGSEEEIAAVRLGDSSNVCEGEHVFAIGHPHGLNYTVTGFI